MYITDLYVTENADEIQGFSMKSDHHTFLYGATAVLKDNIPPLDLTITAVSNDEKNNVEIAFNCHFDNSDTEFINSTVDFERHGIVLEDFAADTIGSLNNYEQEGLFRYLFEKCCTMVQQNETKSSLAVDLPFTPSKAMTEVKEKLKQILSDCTYGTMCCQISPNNYEDYIHEDDVMRCLNEYMQNNDGYDRFTDYLTEWFSNLCIDDDSYLFKEIEDKADAEFCGTELEDAYHTLTDSDGIYRVCAEQLGYEGVTFDIEDFLRHTYRFNLFLETEKEENYDLSLFYSDPEKFGDDRYRDNALTYLIEQQGHTVQETLDVLSDKAKTDSEFLNSIKQETGDCFGDNKLTVLVGQTSSELVDFLNAYASGKGSIVLGTKSCLGLYDAYEGSGGQLGITLEKPAEFPVSMIKGIQLEKAGKENHYGYTVDDCYGLVRSAWVDDLKVKEEPDKEKPKQVERE